MKHHSNSILFDIFSIIVGLIVLLFGVHIVSLFSSNEVASYIDVIPMTIALWVVVKMLRVEQYVGKKAVNMFLVAGVFLSYLILIYSSNFAFSSDGYFYHALGADMVNEQFWAHSNIINLSNMSINEMLNGEMESLNLSKYQNAFLYTSLIFRYGGDVLTHICIMRAFHTFLSAILIMLSAVKMGTTDNRELSAILIACMFMPMMNCFFAYNHDAAGYFFISLGVYIFACTYKNSVASLIAFPVYALLFYWFRRPYAMIAVFLYLWTVVGESKKTVNTAIGLFAALIMMFVFLANVSLNDFFMDEMGVGVYSEGAFGGRGLINVLLVGVLGYFPWTNLVKDALWPYHLFACIQGAFNVVVLYYVYKSYKNKPNEFFKSPMILAALIFLLSALVVPGHMSYTSVSMLLFLVALKDIDLKHFFQSYGKIINIIAVVGFIYSMVGIGGYKII